MRINPSYQIVPGTASHWAQTSPTTWEFYLIPGIMWSDGNELTANDYVETFRYSADPKHAWDFTWYWSGVIKNYTEAVAGKAPVNSIGVGVGHESTRSRSPPKHRWPTSPMRCSTRCRSQRPASPSTGAGCTTSTRPPASPAGPTCSRRSTRRPKWSSRPTRSTRPRTSRLSRPRWPRFLRRH